MDRSIEEALASFGDPQSRHRVASAIRRVFANDEIAMRLLSGHEAMLGGARPIDALAIQGAQSVLDVLEAIAAGGFA